ncbi:hypothetical protein RSO01_81980 [Reyranella soli]|uniref:Uncharacterized protein n=1 Tax=Reyranella soli TaxID=1230389 RepID=A0A512NQ39_9HYPH|nr:hypothetical protein RSO01_81980 [Reyranella soli]
MRLEEHRPRYDSCGNPESGTTEKPALRRFGDTGREGDSNESPDPERSSSDWRPQAGKDIEKIFHGSEP